MTKLNIILSISGLLLLIGCSPKIQIPEGYELVWNDEFSGNSIDTDTWRFWEGPAYNEELQYYTSRSKNAYVENGKLHLVAHREIFNGYEYTSARISTDSTRIGWKYGRFEARIKMPEGNGFWPAFWLMPIRDDGWPRGGEIDIMEYRGNEPYKTTGAIHFWVNGCEGNPVECRTYFTDSVTISDNKLSEEFHVYSLEWDEEGFTWYLDDYEFMNIPYSVIDAQFEPFSTPFYIILNLAVGGNFLPNPDETTPFPQQLIVDYVRVFQRK